MTGHVPQNEYHKVRLTREEQRIKELVELLASYICAEIIVDIAKEQMKPERERKWGR